MQPWPWPWPWTMAGRQAVYIYIYYTYCYLCNMTLWCISLSYSVDVIVFFLPSRFPWFGHVFSNKGRFHKRKVPGFFYSTQFDLLPQSYVFSLACLKTLSPARRIQPPAAVPREPQHLSMWTHKPWPATAPCRCLAQLARRENTLLKNSRGYPVHPCPSIVSNRLNFSLSCRKDGIVCENCALWNLIQISN